MSTPPVLDAEPFTEPIPGDDPAGARIRSRLMDLNQIKEWQKDVDPERDGSSEPGQPPIDKVVPQPAKIIDFAAKYLKQTGKDLEVCLYLTEALTKTQKFAGLRDGLKIIRRVCETCWTAMHPVMDDPGYEEDVRGRTDLFSYLTEPDNRPYFPRSVRSTALFKTSDGLEVSYQACQTGPNNQPAKLSREDALNALRAGGPPRLALLRTYLEDIEEAKSELRALGTYLDTAAAAAAPGFTDLRKALDDCGSFIAGFVNAVGGGGGESNSDGDAPAEDSSSGGAAAAGGGGPATALGAVRSREDVYRRLQDLLGLLAQYDPHSPVPHLLRRAIEMKDLDFPQLIDVLTKEAGVMNFLRNPVGG